MVLVICFDVLINENIIATVNLDRKFTAMLQLLVILNLFGDLGVCFVFIVLRIYQLLLTRSLLWLILLTFQYFVLSFRNQIFLNFNRFVNLFLLYLRNFAIIVNHDVILCISENLILASFYCHGQDF
tara:strand:+ start:2823 stop:3203 length:381 start_codon:yes stop_codon:yes gene_type:complete